MDLPDVSPLMFGTRSTGQVVRVNVPLDQIARQMVLECTDHSVPLERRTQPLPNAAYASRTSRADRTTA